MQIRNTTIDIIRADITELDVEAIVNPANNQLLMGGGLAGVIRKKGGAEIEAEALKKGLIAVGDSISTHAGKLKHKFVIHAATMAMDFKTDEHIIRQASATLLKCADELKIKSLAIPALGCGVGGFSYTGAARIMIQEVLTFLRAHPQTSLQTIIFCLYDQNAFEVFDTTIRGYVKHFQDDLGWGPYVTVDVIIELPEGIVLIERSNPPLGWALPGGFLDYGESLEQAALREAKEETNLDLDNVRQFHTYSDPSRDPRFHTISTVFIATGIGRPQFGDDAKGLTIVPYDQLLKRSYAFDHGQIIRDYLDQQ